MSSEKDDLHETPVKFTVERSPPQDSSSSPSELTFCGPVLPPHLLEKRVENEETGKIYGPMLPHHSSEGGTESEKEKTLSTWPGNNDIFIGPTLPENLECSQATSEEERASSSCDADDSFGPSVHLMATGDVDGSHRLTSSQKSMTKIPEDRGVKRETWMTELPEKRRVNFGLVPRHFKSQLQTEKESDDSVWTDTPADKNKKHPSKKDHKEVLRIKRLEERDKLMEKLSKRAAKKSRKKESLLEMHLKNMKKKKKKETKKNEKGKEPVPQRRPFDRNIDLQIRKVDETQKRAILNKSQFLNDRFAPGQSKFL